MGHYPSGRWLSALCRCCSPGSKDPCITQREDGPMNVGFADITLPLWLVVSQWTLLFALGFLIIIMYRQVAFLQRLRDGGSEREGLPIGEKAPVFDYLPVNGRSSSGHFDPRGSWSLLVFADPTCVSCQ